jgi:hypothetical protein
LDQTLFWTAADLEQKLRLFQNYFNRQRVHSGLEGRLPEPQDAATPLTFDSYRWSNTVTAPIRHPSPRDSQEFAHHRIRDAFFPFIKRKWKLSTACTSGDRIRKHLIGDLDAVVLESVTRDSLQKYLEQKAAAGLSFSVVDYLRWDLRRLLCFFRSSCRRLLYGEGRPVLCGEDHFSGTGRRWLAVQ